MSKLRRVAGVALAAGLAWWLAGCSGKALKYETLKQVQPNMSLAEVEAILGKGDDSSAEDIAKATQHGGPGPGGQITYKTWKDSKTLLVLGFRNDRVTASFFTSTDTELAAALNKDREAKNPNRPPAGGGGTGGAGEGGTPEVNEPMLHHHMSVLAGQLLTYADTHKGRLPADLKELEQWGNWSVFPAEVQQAVHSGEFVVAWGAPLGRFENDKVIAWQKDAPTRGGFAAKGSGVAEKLTADQIKARMAKK